MINFRFHLVSLIAVFLALGLGILVGSSVVDQVFVDRLEKDISTYRHEANERKAENARLKDQISELEDSMSAAAPYAVQQRLQDVPVVLIAERGVDSGALKQTMTMLEQAGAEVPGVMWLDDSWRLDDSKQLRALQDVVGVVGNAASTRSLAFHDFARRVAEPPTTSTASTSSTDVLQALNNSGFITMSGGKSADLVSFPSSASRAFVVTGTNSHLGGSDTLVQLVRALTDARVPTVVGEVYDDTAGSVTTARGDAVAPVRGNAALSKIVATVDDAELVQGRVSAVLALEQLASGTVGHYGYGRGASAPLPSVAS